jgi:hypothetical protein
MNSPPTKINVEIIIPVVVWYDPYEKENGDGFYPIFYMETDTPPPSYESTTIQFKMEFYNDYNIRELSKALYKDIEVHTTQSIETHWKQYDNDNITGFDGKNPQLIIQYLNRQSPRMKAYRMVNKHNREIGLSNYMEISRL